MSIKYAIYSTLAAYFEYSLKKINVEVKIQIYTKNGSTLTDNKANSSINILLYLSLAVHILYPSIKSNPNHIETKLKSSILINRAVLAEFVSSFFYVFIVCGAASACGVGASVSSVLLATALAAGFSIATLTQCFLDISGKILFFI